MRPRASHAGRLVVALGSAGGLATAIYLGPFASAVPAIRRRFLPGLSGLAPPRARSATVALTFDDGPDPASTPQVLDALDELGWKATFFLLGSLVERDPSGAAAVAAAGHEVGVHGTYHRSHVLRSPGWIRRDVVRARDVIADATGRRPVLFRPPYGSISLGTVLAARHAGLRTVLWSSAGRDWEDGATGASVAANVARDLRPGGTILLHDSDCTSASGSWRSTLAALPLIAEDVRARGLRVVPAGEHLALARS